jgi:hypothetical protein
VCQGCFDDTVAGVVEIPERCAARRAERTHFRERPRDDAATRARSAGCRERALDVEGVHQEVEVVPMRRFVLPAIVTFFMIDGIASYVYCSALPSSYRDA